MARRATSRYQPAKRHSTPVLSAVLLLHSLLFSLLLREKLLRQLPVVVDLSRVEDVKPLCAHNILKRGETFREKGHQLAMIAIQKLSDDVVTTRDVTDVDLLVHACQLLSNLQHL